MRNNLQSVLGISTPKSVNPLDFLQQHAREIIEIGAIEEKKDGFGSFWQVSDKTDDGSLLDLIVRSDINGNRSCSCDWFQRAVKQRSRIRCAHILAVEIYLDALLPANFPRDAAHNPNMADSDKDSITESQYKMIKALGRGMREDVEALSQQIYGAWIDELNRDAADRFIQHLKAMQILPREVAA